MRECVDDLFENRGGASIYLRALHFLLACLVQDFEQGWGIPVRTPKSLRWTIKFCLSFWFCFSGGRTSLVFCSFKRHFRSLVEK